MKKIVILILSALIIFSGIPVAFAAPAAVAGTVLTGDYVAVVNTGTARQSTGTLNFDASAGAGSKTSKTVEPKGFLPAADVISENGGAWQPELKKGRAANVHTIGETGKFYNNETFVCIGIGRESYVWMEQGLYSRYSAANRTQVGKEVAAMYDGRPSEVVKELSGGQDFYKDGSGKLSIMISEINSSSGFYAGEDGITAIHINAVPPDKYSAGAYGKYDGLLVHETQHAMFRWLACGGDKSKAYQVSWINEGLSVAAMDYYWGGDDPTGWLTRINGDLSIRNGSSLMYDAYRNNSAQDYSMPDLFIRYLASQKEKGYSPIAMMKCFYNAGMAAGEPVAYVNGVLKKAGLTGTGGDLTFQEALVNFYVAASAQENTGKYGFFGDPVVRNVITDYPVYAGTSGQAVALDGSAALILKTKNGTFTVPADAGSDIRFVAFSKTTKPKLPAAGDGSPQNPYQITNAEEFATLSNASEACFKLMKDIDVSSVVAFPAETFTGTFDGNGHMITGMTKPLVSTNRGNIKNLTVNGFSGEFRTWTGVISNFNSGTISDCAVTGSVNVRFTSTKAFNLPSFGTMTAQNEMSGVITRCYTDANVTVAMPENTDYVGMIAGENQYEISNCYARGSLTVNGSAGGIDLSVGGIVGDQYSSLYPKPSLEDCYSVTSITIDGGGSALKAGQIAGSVENASSMSGCYGLNGSFNMVGVGRTAGAEAKSDGDMKLQATYAGWAFGSVWQMPAGGYPAFYAPDSVSANMSKTEYYVGESLDFYNATLTIGSGKVPLSADMVGAFDSSTPGVKVITGSYKGKAFSFSVTVKAPINVTSLMVYEKPRTEYSEGEKFDPAGTRLRATVDGKPNVYIRSGFTVNKTAALTTADSKVTYTYGNATLDLDISVFAKAARVQSVSVMDAPKKLTGYYVGDRLDLDGLKVQIVYKDGSKSVLLGWNDFAANDLHVSKGADTTILNGDVLQDADDKKSLYVYHGSVLPKDAGSIFAEIGVLGVGRTLWLDDQEVDMTVGRQAYARTDSVDGVSGWDDVITTTLKSGALPGGITLTQAPSNMNDYQFVFEGTPASIGTTTAVYTIMDKGSGRSIDVTFTFRVNNPSSACDIERFTVWQKLGVGQTAYAGKIDQSSQTIKVTVPDSFNIASLAYSIVASKNAAGGITSSGVDFSGEKAITITAEDGTTKKTYRVNVVKASSVNKLVTPQNLKWSAGTAQWDAVSGADGYVVELFERPRMEDPAYDNGIGSVNITAGTQCDLSSHMGKRTNYYFTVTAYKADNSYLDSDRAQSGIYTLVPEVRGVTVSPMNASVGAGGSASFIATVTGLGAYKQEVMWSVSGALSANTKIVGGKLSVGTDEAADELTVRATSVQDVTKYAEAIVTVEPLPHLAKAGNLKWTGKTGSWDAVANAQGYRVALMKDGAAVGAAKEKTTASIDFSADIAAAGPGQYTFRVQAYATGYVDGEVVESPVYSGAKSVPIKTNFGMDRAEAVYNKTTQGVTISPKSGVVGMGAVTVKYNGGTGKPTRAGTYTVTIDVAEGAHYTAAVNLEIGTFTITPREIKTPAVTLPVATQESLVNGGLANNLTLALKAPEIYAGDVVHATGNAKYLQSTFTTTAEVDNADYRLAAGTIITKVSYELTEFALTGIAVTTPPAKTDYSIGDAFDKTGLAVTASWENGDETDVTDSVLIVTDMPLRADSKVFVRYETGRGALEQEIPIMVTPAVQEESVPVKIPEQLEIPQQAERSEMTEADAEIVHAEVNAPSEDASVAESKTVPESDAVDVPEARVKAAQTDDPRSIMIYMISAIAAGVVLFYALRRQKA